VPAADAEAAARRKRLAAALRSAARLPGYRATIAPLAGELETGLDPLVALRSLPLLERSSIQADPDAFRDSSVRSVVLSSSGSSGTPLVLHLDRRARHRRQLQFMRYYLRSGWRPWHVSLSLKVLPDPSARLGSSLLDRTILRRRRAISVLEPISRQYEILRELDPHVLHGLPSVLEGIALLAERDGWRPRRLRRIFSGSEALTPRARALIERALGAPALETYAAAEGLIAWQCERREGLHVFEQNVFVEVLGEDGEPVGPGEVGRVAITTLDNPAMPLVRYAIGDMAVAPLPGGCPCGRPGKLLPAVLGRQVPLFEIDGSRVSPWGVIARMSDIEAIREFQLLHPGPDRVLVLVRESREGRLDRGDLEALVHEELGPSVHAEVRVVESIDRATTGKAGPWVLAPALEPQSEAY
jgi:phenylacetate-CoA ligase